jgi:hypothetical protein
METVFEFRYTDCYHESSMLTISIHRTKLGAEEALKYHKKIQHDTWEEMYLTTEDRELYPFPGYEKWDVIETTLEE